MFRNIKFRKIIKKCEPYLYILPSLIFFSTFTFFPFLKTIYNSFFLLNSQGEIREFVGFANYIKVITDPLFHKAILNTFIFVVISSPGSIIIAFILAIISSKKTKISAVYVTMFALTMAMSVSVTAMIFNIMYSPSIGILNKLLGTDINWLKDTKYAMISLSMIRTWINIGFNYLFLLAAIRNIPKDLLESADIDGATGWKKTRYIVVPLVSHVTIFLVVNSLARSIIMADLPIILTEGGPNGATTTMIYYMFQKAFSGNNYNSAYPAAIITFFVTLAVILLTFKFEKKGVHYQ